MSLWFGTTNIEETSVGKRNIDESRRFGVRIIINQLVIICSCIDVFSWIDYFNIDSISNWILSDRVDQYLHAESVFPSDSNSYRHQSEARITFAIAMKPLCVEMSVLFFSICIFLFVYDNLKWISFFNYFGHLWYIFLFVCTIFCTLHLLMGTSFLV